MIKVANIQDCWGQIRPGLEIIKAKTGADWSPEDIKIECMEGRWVLFVDDGVDGFLITRLYQCGYTGTKRLEVVCAYHSGRDIDPVATYLPFIKALAFTACAKEIEVRSPRRGWERKGFKVVDVVYRMEVSQ